MGLSYAIGGNIMRLPIAIIAITLIAATAAPINAQDEAMGEIVVTAQRTSGEYYEDEQPVIGLRRTADSAVQTVLLTSDSRDEATRKREILNMLESAINRADAAGVALVDGNFELLPITLANYKDLIFGSGNRPDTSQVSFYVKAKLAGSTGSAQSRIDNFIKAVPPSGRALLEKQGGLTLTIINPDQYRDQIVKLVATESLKYAGYFGSDYGVDVAGLDAEIKWAQASGTEVFLFIPYRFSIKPK
jgi:hypothetical protein